MQESCSCWILGRAALNNACSGGSLEKKGNSCSNATAKRLCISPKVWPNEILQPD